jgi:hypothetical protein
MHPLATHPEFVALLVVVFFYSDHLFWSEGPCLKTQGDRLQVSVSGLFFFNKYLLDLALGRFA